jgi:hypothetical protein
MTSAAASPASPADEYLFARDELSFTPRLVLENNTIHLQHGVSLAAPARLLTSFATPLGLPGAPTLPHHGVPARITTPWINVKGLFVHDAASPVDHYVCDGMLYFDNIDGHLALPGSPTVRGSWVVGLPSPRGRTATSTGDDCESDSISNGSGGHVHIDDERCTISGFVDARLRVTQPSVVLARGAKRGMDFAVVHMHGAYGGVSAGIFIDGQLRHGVRRDTATGMLSRVGDWQLNFVHVAKRRFVASGVKRLLPTCPLAYVESADPEQVTRRYIYTALDAVLYATANPHVRFVTTPALLSSVDDCYSARVAYALAPGSTTTRDRWLALFCTFDPHSDDPEVWDWVWTRRFGKRRAGNHVGVSCNVLMVSTNR